MFDLNKVYSAENGTDIFFKYIEPSFKRCAFGPRKQGKIALAGLGNDAGIYGAAALGLK